MSRERRVFFACGFLLLAAGCCLEPTVLTALIRRLWPETPDLTNRLGGIRLFIRSLRWGGGFLMAAPVIEHFFPKGADFLYERSSRLFSCFENRTFRFGFLWGVFILTLLLGLFGTHFLPIVSDEHAYRFQAQTLAGGKLWAPIHPLMEFFRAEQTLVSDGKWFGKYTFGWPVLLAIGHLLRLPWIVNPFLGAILLWVLYALALRVTGERSVAGVALVLVSISAFFLFNVVSWFPHVASALCIGGLLWAVVVIQDERKEFLAWPAGLLFGLELVIRPQDAMAVGLPLFLFLLCHKKSDGLKCIARMLPGTVGFILLTGLYNTLLMGDPFTFPYLIYDPLDRLGFGGVNSPGAALRRTFFHLARLHLWFFPYALAFLLAPILSRKRWSERMLYWCLLGVVVGPLLYYHEGGISYGPRYYFAGIVPFGILAARGIVLSFRCFQGEVWRRQLTLFLFGCLLLNCLHFADHFGRVREWIRPNALYREVRLKHLKNALIFISIRSPLVGKQGMLFNSPFLEGPVLYAVDLGKANTRLMDHYPNRRPYLAMFEENGDRWRLEPLR